MRTESRQRCDSEEVFLSIEQRKERQLRCRDGCRSCERRWAAVRESRLFHCAWRGGADSPKRLFVLYATRLVRRRQGKRRRCELVRRQRRIFRNRFARAPAFLPTGPRERRLGRGKRSIFYHAGRAVEHES